MTSARPPVPPVNLRDRIAALEQRKTTPEPHTTHVTPVLPTSTRANALREKIASFEKQGAVPVPRGSFGIGAPPVDDGSTKRKGELYGNRVPGLSKPAIESIAAARKRAVSSHGASPSLSVPSSRPVTPSFLDSYEENSLPPLLDVAAPEPRLPSTLPSLGRRAVSDVLPQTSTSPGNSDDAPIVETEEEHVQLESKPEVPDVTTIEQTAEVTVEPEQPEVEVTVLDAPAIIVSPESKTPVELPTSEPQAAFSPVIEQVESPLPPALSVSTVEEPNVEEQSISPITPVPSEAVVEPTDQIPSPASAYSPIQSPSPQSPAVSLHDEIGRQSPAKELSPTLSETSSEIIAESPATPVDILSPASTSLGTMEVEESPIPNQVEVVSPVSSTQSVSVADVTSASTSPLPTPADSVFSEFSVATEISSVAADLPSPSPGPSISAVFGTHLASPVTPQTGRTEVSEASFYPPTPDVPWINTNLESEVADESLALDTSDAVIVVDPLVISPTVTQGRLIPAPRPSNPSPPITPSTANTVSSPSTGSPVKRYNAASKNLPPLVSPTPSEDLFSVNQYDGRLSFHAVVHEKVRQPSTSTTASPVDPPRNVNALRFSSRVEPGSPKFSDLADLMLDAALLEQQLSAVPSVKPAKASPLVESTGPTTPEKKPATPQRKSSVHSRKSTAERVLAPLAPPPSMPLPQAPGTPATPVRKDSLTHFRKSREQPRQEVPQAVDGSGPSEVESDLAKEIDIQFTKSWNPSLVLPSPGSSSLPYLAGTPPDSPTSRRNTPGRSSLTTGTPVRMRTISHSPAATPPHTTPTRLRTISHHNLSRSAPVPKDDDIPPTPPPKSPRKYLNLRRKPTMPGSYPRESLSSEDSSVHIPTPPSPSLIPTHDRSDASSIMSSTKSTKSGKSSLTRATSVMDRLWRRGKNKHTSVSVVDGDDDNHLSAGRLRSRDPSPSHLSPFTLPPSAHGHSAPSTMQQRPTSWVSIETTGSNGEPFDSDIFDAFPTVPDQVPPLPSDQFGQSQSLNALGQRRPASTAHTFSSSNFLTKESEIGYAPQRGHTKQRSSLL